MIVCCDQAENAVALDAMLLAELTEKTGRTTRNVQTISLAFAEKGVYAGGLLAQAMFESCYIELLAVKKEFRGRGIARQLVEAMETHVRTLGLHTIHLTTQDYQAKGFYLKMGYTCIAEVTDLPFVGTTRYYFLKRL